MSQRDMNLPTPQGRQREVLALPAAGHTVVLGTAGSGKTTLAILRSAFLADPATEHGGKTLLVTFNKALVAYLRYLGGALHGVVVENYHRFARGYLSSRGKMNFNSICDGARRRTLIGTAYVQVSHEYGRNLASGTPAPIWLDEEIRWISHHGIRTLTEYEALTASTRPELDVDPSCLSFNLSVANAYVSLREKAGFRCDWDDIATLVLSELQIDSSSRLYRHIVIDEAQDFSPEMLRSLVAAVPPDGSVTIFGDATQQIYGHRVSWRSAGLNVREPWVFRDNYRNTSQIAALALAIAGMPWYRSLPDLVLPVAPKAHGPLPGLVKCGSLQSELDLVRSRAEAAAKTQRVAVLVRHREQERLLGLPVSAIRLHRDMSNWNPAPGIRFGTYHAAKGLEFDTVILPFCDSVSMPPKDTVEAYGEQEAFSREAKLLYVGVTRAKTRLLITYQQELTDLLPASPSLYQAAQL